VSANPDVNGHVTKRGGRLAVTVSKGIKKVTVPTDLLSCSTTPDAAKALEKLGFDNVTVKSEYSASAASGCGLASSVEPGTTVAHNAALTLTVSKGPKPVQIPDKLTGESQADATAALEKLQLSVSVKTEFSDSIAKGAVISASPASGETAHWGDKVTLTVSKGPETVTMPNVVGSGTDAAVKKLEALGFKVTTKASAIGETLHVVFSQSAASGKAVRLRDTAGKPTVITLTIV
jgi:serine/threonine-protein kinase